jgi:hypothetical protein
MIKLKSLLLEQDENYWNNVKETINSKDGSSYKQVTKEYPSVPLLDPKTGKQFAYAGDAVAGKLEWEPLYIGAWLNISYAPKGNKGKTFNESNFFMYNLAFFLATKPGITYSTMNSARGVEIFYINCRRLGTGKFEANMKLKTYKPNALLYLISNKDDTNKDTYIQGNDLITPNGFLSNPSGYAASLVSTINTEIAKAGFPQLPNAFQQGLVTV